MAFPEDLSTNPCKAWDTLKDDHKVETVVPISPLAPQPKNVVRFVCISDTHNTHNELQHPVPAGDVLLHTGDFTRKGSLAEASTFNTWLGTLPHRHKIVIAGNHEKIFDHDSNPNARPGTEVITNATYLQDSSTTVCGFKVYGSPWTPEYHVTAFNLPRGDALRRRWAKIPEDLDILMTHGPPLGYGDLNHRNIRSGCIDLLRAVKTRVKPKFHVYGHIHEGFSMTTDGYTTFVNASTCNRRYKPVNPAMVFDVPLPPGATKEK